MIESVFDEYGWVFVEADELPDFVAFATFYAAPESPHRLWTLELDGRPAGCIALKAGAEGAYLSRVYLHAEHRGHGYGKRMVLHALADAKARGFRNVHLWTDTRFLTAHKLYEAVGFVRQNRLRALHDINISFEIRYETPPW